MSLNGDLISEILSRVDGITLANAECVCSEFWSIARQESMWEEKCCYIWPSTKDTDIKGLISSSPGGFKKFYAGCFPVVVYDGDSQTILCKGSLEVHNAVHSDFVWVVDVVYNNKPIYSKIIWGIPSADDFPAMFSDFPFKMELINFYDVVDDGHNFEDELPSIFIQEKGHKCWEQLMENIRLSWILINKRTGQAVNLSSWRPLVGKIEWPSQKDFILGFGCILPTHNICPSKFVHCSLLIKCRISDGDHTSLKITKISMELEDMMGVRVNGKNSVFILERALGCRRSKYHDKISQSYQKYLIDKCTVRETKMKSEGCRDTVCNLCGILAFASFSYFIYKLKGFIF